MVNRNDFCSMGHFSSTCLINFLTLPLGISHNQTYQPNLQNYLRGLCYPYGSDFQKKGTLDIETIQTRRQKCANIYFKQNKLGSVLRSKNAFINIQVGFYFLKLYDRLPALLVLRNYSKRDTNTVDFAVIFVMSDNNNTNIKTG